MIISVIIPCYNVQDCIAEAVQSTITQTYNHLEIICIDNNSTDQTWAVLKNLQKQHPQLIIDKEPKTGANHARNRGLHIAKGEWIQFLDADDLLEKTKIEHQARLIQGCEHDTSFVAAASKSMNMSGKVTVNKKLSRDFYLAPFINQAGNTCANLWSGKWLLRVNMWNEDIRSSQETDLMLRLILAGGRCLYDHEPLTIIRERKSGQISQSNPVNRWKRYLDIRLNYLRKLKEVNYKEYERLTPRFYDFLMVSIITLGKYNQGEALGYYEEIKKNNWRSANMFGMSKYKNLLIRLFGFQFYLKLANYLRK